VIVVVPFATPVASPAELIVATLTTLEDQVTSLETFCVYSEPFLLFS
jgi:hypothetical protein